MDDLLLGVGVALVLIIGFEMWRASKIEGTYTDEDGVEVRIISTMDVSNKTSGYVLVRTNDPVRYSLGDFNLLGWDVIKADKQPAGKLSQNLVSGQLSLKIGDSVKLLQKKL